MLIKDDSRLSRRRVLRGILNGDVDAGSPQETTAFFARLWPHTFPGELYVATADNVLRFCTSMIDAIDRVAPDRPARIVRAAETNA